MFHDDVPAALSPPLVEAREWRLIDVLFGALLLLGGVVVVLAIGFAATHWGGSARRAPGVAVAIAISTLAFEAWVGGAVLIVARHRGLSFGDLGFVQPRAWSFVLLAVCGAYAVEIGYAVAVWGIQQLTGLDLSRFNAGNGIPEELRGSRLVWAIIGVSVVVAAPLGEELFFRGLVFRALRPRLPLWLALLSSGVAFACMHFNLSVVVPFTLIGMIFAWAYRASGSLWTTIAAHAILNGVSLVLTMAGVGR